MRHNLLATAVAAGLGLAALAASAPASAGPQSAPVSATDLDALKAQIAALQAQLDALQERTEAQSDINVANAQAAEASQAATDKLDKLSKLVNDTKISGRLYYDLTSIDDSSKGAKTDKSGTAFDVAWTSPTQGPITFGWDKPLVANGKDQPLSGYPRIESPWAKVPWDSTTYDIKAGGETLHLDVAKPTRRASAFL